VSEHCYHIYQKLLNSTYAFKCYHQQEGQHPLTGQRAPPISGGT